MVFDVKNLTTILITIVLFGVSVFFRKLAVDRIHPFQIQVISAVIYGLLTPIWLVLCNKQNATHYDTMGVAFAVVCVLTSVLAGLAYGFALQKSDSPGVVSALASLSPVITIALSIIFLSEKLSITKMVAFFLALASAILVSL